MGSMVAVLVTAALVKGFIKPVKVLVLYSALATIMLIIIYFVQTPTICLIGGFVIGFTAAGGVQRPKYALLLNVAITVVGVLLALFVSKQLSKESVA